MRVKIWQRSLALALSASLMASPAMAGGPRHQHGRGCGHGHHGHGRGHDHHGRGRWVPAVYRAPVHHHHHHKSRNRVDAGDILLATAVGLGVVALWTVAQQQAHANAQVQAFEAPLGAPVGWSEGGADGTVVAVSEGIGARGEYCREFSKEIRVGGRSESGWGIACRQPDGSWRVTQ